MPMDSDQKSGTPARRQNGDGDWSTEQLAEFLDAISASETDEEAIEAGVRQAAAMLETEICIYARDRSVIASAGLPDHGGDTEALLDLPVGDRAATIDIEGIGECKVAVVPVIGSLGGHLILARTDRSFDSPEYALVRAMGDALSLTVGKISTVRAERERLTLLTRLSLIQRSISHHAPLQEVLDAISEGASKLLGEHVAGIVITDERDTPVTQSLIGVEPETRRQILRRPLSADALTRAMQGGALVVIDDLQSEPGMHPLLAGAGIRAVIAAPIREAGRVSGALIVGSMTAGRRYSEEESEALTAFADYASLALTDARLSDQVERALRDPLTGLPNRPHLAERLAERLEEGTPTGLIALDLDSFHSVNDRIGHRAGDELLRELGIRLQADAGAETFVARLDGDAFALLCSSEEASDLAARLLGTVTNPFAIAGRELRTTASIGVVGSGSDPDQMFRDVDLAMYRAKAEGGDRVVLFQDDMHRELMRRMELEDDLARALVEDEIVAYFQPKADLRTGRVIGVEALVRWDHPERGLLSPGEFLDLAEAGGHMRALTERVIEFATRAAGDWWHSGLGLQLSVNLPASGFSATDYRIDAFVKRTLASTGLPGTALQFEVTEDALMTDPETAAEVLNRLSKLGSTISIDDFGTGHSSLGRLKSLPIDELKIDRSFILDLTNEEDKTIVRSTIHLAHQMGLQVVAEGVETEEAWRLLRSMGCERAQGFLIAKPLPAREVPAWLASWNQRARQLSSARRIQRRKEAEGRRAEEKAKAPA